MALQGELDFAFAAEAAGGFAEIDSRRVTVDLSGLKLMNSTGIAALIMARNQMKSDGEGSLIVNRPVRTVRTMLEVSGRGDWIVEWSPDWCAWRPEWHE